MRGASPRLRRFWRATRPWLIAIAVGYAAYFGLGLVAMTTYYDIDVGATVFESVPGWLFLASAAVTAGAAGTRVVDRFTPNFEPGRPRDEHLDSTARWFDEED